MIDLSIILPCIRPHNVQKVLDSFKKSCKKYSYEVIIASPYILPEEVLKTPNVTYLHSYSSPVVCYQLMVGLCRGKYVFNMSDDCIMQEDSLDWALDTIEGYWGTNTIINMTYAEGLLNYNNLEEVPPSAMYPAAPPDDYWRAHHHPELRLPAIKDYWHMILNFVMHRKFLIHMGGFDCGFEFLSHAIMDLGFRCQAIGVNIVRTPKLAFKCAHMIGNTGDHGPVVESQIGFDQQRFKYLYSDPENLFNRTALGFNNNIEDAPLVWSRRFNESSLPCTI